MGKEEDKLIFKKLAQQSYANRIIPIKEIPQLVILIHYTQSTMEKFLLFNTILNSQLFGEYKDKVVIKFAEEEDYSKVQPRLMEMAKGLKARWYMYFDINRQDMPDTNYIKSLMELISENKNRPAIMAPDGLVIVRLTNDGNE